MTNSDNLDQGSRPFACFPLCHLRFSGRNAKMCVNMWIGSLQSVEELKSQLPHHRYCMEYFSFTNNVCQVFGFMQLLVGSVWETVHNFAHWFLDNNIHYLSNCLQKCPISVNVRVCYLPTFLRRCQKKKFTV